MRDILAHVDGMKVNRVAELLRIEWNRRTPLNKHSSPPYKNSNTRILFLHQTRHCGHFSFFSFIFFSKINKRTPMFIPESRVPQTPMSQYLWHRHFQIHNYLHQIGVFGLFLDCYAPENVCVKDIDSQASMVLQKYQDFTEMTSNMIYIFAFGVGLKCPCKIQVPCSADQ